jgi:hypothetical protein
VQTPVGQGAGAEAGGVRVRGRGIDEDEDLRREGEVDLGRGFSEFVVGIFARVVRPRESMSRRGKATVEGPASARGVTMGSTTP